MTVEARREFRDADIFGGPAATGARCRCRVSGVGCRVSGVGRCASAVALHGIVARSRAVLMPPPAPTAMPLRQDRELDRDLRKLVLSLGLDQSGARMVLVQPRQRRWLALSAVAIVGPCVELTSPVLPLRLRAHSSTTR